MEDVEKLYKEDKLLVRAMDYPSVIGGKDNGRFECQPWVDEFYSLMHDGIDSLSTTLIVPGVGVRNYKNVGFLINSDLADCFHISKIDSNSCGSYRHGDFQASKKDYSHISELAEYIKENDATEMNEVNINTKIDAVLGLYINKCEHANWLLKNIYVIKKMLKALTGIDYPIFMYDFLKGELERIDLSKEQEDEIISGLEANQIFCWPEDAKEPMYIPIESTSIHK